MKQIHFSSRMKLVFILSIFFISSCKQGTDSSDANEIITDSTSLANNPLDGQNLTEEERAALLVSEKDESGLNKAQLQVQKLLESCVSNQFSNAAKTIMYRGGDATRMGFDHFNYSNASEASTVKVTCEVIKSWLGTSASYEFISYNEEKSEYGTQYVVEVMFKKEKIGLDRHFFYLMDTPKGLLLVNMI